MLKTGDLCRHNIRGAGAVWSVYGKEDKQENRKIMGYLYLGQVAMVLSITKQYAFDRVKVLTALGVGYMWADELEKF